METYDQRLERRMRNEQLFRTVNNKLRELNVEFEAFVDEAAVFVCECSGIECIQQIQVPVAVFDAIGARPGQFVVASGHEDPELETVVGGAGAYRIVEKERALF